MPSRKCPSRSLGFVSPLLLLVILFFGLLAGVVLVQRQQIFFPKADSDSAGDNARYQTWNGIKTVGEMKNELKGKTIPGYGNSAITSFDDKSPRQTYKAYQYLPALKTSNNVADQRLFNCALNVGNLDNMSSVPQNAEVGKEVSVTITQKWEDSFDYYGCATGSIVPKVFIGDATPDKVFIQDWGSGKIGVFDGVDHKGVPTNSGVNLPFIFDDQLDGNPTWNAGKCFAKSDIDPQNPGPLDDRGRSLYDLGAGRFVQHGSGGGWYETFVRSCYFTPTAPGNYIVESHNSHGRNECGLHDNNKGDLVAQCKITVYPAGQAPQGALNKPNCTPISDPSNLSHTQNSVTWDTTAGASKYWLRIDDVTANGWTGSCDNVNSGDACDNNVSSNSYNYNFQSGHKYHVWVHAVPACDVSASAANIEFTIP